MVRHRIPHRIKKSPTPARMPPTFRVFSTRIAALVQKRCPFLVRCILWGAGNMRLSAIGKFNFRALSAIWAIN